MSDEPFADPTIEVSAVELGPEAFCRDILEHWGGPVGIETRAPSVAADPAFRDWWAAYLRMGASPAAAVALTRMNAQIDVRQVLPTIRVPTLVLHRTGDRCLLAATEDTEDEHQPENQARDDRAEDDQADVAALAAFVRRRHRVGRVGRLV